MPSRREFMVNSCAAFGALSLVPWRPDAGADLLIEKSNLEFLCGLAQVTISSATRKDSVEATGTAMVTPGGNYPAFWVRDFSMAVGCGLIPVETIHEHLILLAKAQNGETEIRLDSGGIVPPYAVPDHINFDGKAVFYPGTYSSGLDQGGEPWGVLPPVDDHFEFVHIAHTLWKRTKNTGFLDEEVAGMGLYERLVKALECPESDVKTGLVVTEAKRRAVGFGFCDSVFLTGDLLFASLLRYRALGGMIDLGGAANERAQLTEWKKQRELIGTHLASAFQKDGWLIAATGVGRQPDVWGTALALCLGVLSGTARRQAIDVLVEAHKGGTISCQGAVRHVPTDHDYSTESAWEKTAGVPVNRYQNGAYWHVATGWLARALAMADRKSAKTLVAEMVAHFRIEDFRTGGGKGGPWECFHPDGEYRQNPVYMASVTLPLELLSSR